MSAGGIFLIVGYVLFLVIVGIFVVKYCKGRQRDNQMENEEEKTASRTESSSSTRNNERDVEEGPEIIKEENAPINIQNTNSTKESYRREEGDGVEVTLTSSSSSSRNDQTRDDIEDEQTNYPYVLGRHAHHHVGPGPGKTIDVHVCRSGVCEQCSKNRRKGVQFVSVEPLEPKMIKKLQTQPKSWWEFGSFIDLYNQANGPSNASDLGSIWGRFSLSRKQRAKRRLKRSMKMVSSDGDEEGPCPDRW